MSAHAAEPWPRPNAVLLGTALWGWGVDQGEAAAMLDTFARGGGRWVDTAANYPINGVAADHGLALRWLGEWLRDNPGSGLRVWAKVGAIDNTGSPDVNLSSAAVYVWAELVRAAVGDALGCLAVHWDPRHEVEAVAETVDAMRELGADGLELGLSGVKRPDLYALCAPDLATRWWAQVKENLETRDARVHLMGSLPRARFVAYGLNGGGRLLASAHPDRASTALRGLRPLDSEWLRVLGELGATTTPDATGPGHLALLHAACNPALDGIVIGPRTRDQLAETLDYWRLVCTDLDADTRRRLSGLLLQLGT